ncbi:class V chitinase, putative [Aspergillus fumigatus A1163]|uniref:chitinase n=1 Tax=Aspergillus fumigatus (strain CBS 144.89 / FGSC A1163 / CEA10) TaxID=451804 RepID=B0YBH2_ASPFC|nr:class V chitinase, putative [Aspergillus fumigatus A1163]
MLSAQKRALAKLDAVQNMQEAVVLALNFVASGTAQAPAMQKQSADNMHQQGTKNAPSMFAVRHLGFVGQHQRLLSRFCGDGCQNGCGEIKRPSSTGTSARSRTIGYYEAWSYARQCDSVAPEDIDANLWTHINFAFGLIHPETFQLSKMNSYDDQLYPRVANLKLQNPSLKVFIAIGGWDAGGKVFSDMVSTAENRATFIKSVVQFCQTQAFDGIDIDWEYPVADDRGGRAEDFANYVTFVKELRSAAGRLGISLTLPSSYWYLKGFDVVNLEPYVDWFNFMSYDIHGTWDGNNAYTKQVVNPHTNLTEISQGLDLLWRNNIPSKKVVLGLGFYGRSFTLSDPSCNTPGCPFASGANPGECTGQAGILSNAEINRVIRTHDLTPVMDKAAGVKYITWDNNQWVSYDDADTLKIKMDFANKLGLGGTMVWALDLDNADSQSAQYLNSGGNMTNTNGFSIAKKAADTQQAVAAKLAFWTPCMTEKERKVLGCPGGYHELLVGHGKVYDADDFRAVEGCHGSLNRLLCLSNEAVGRNCAWNRRPDGVRDNSKCIICTWLISVFRARYVISAALRVPSISLRIRTQPATRRTVPMVLTFQFVAKISRPLRSGLLVLPEERHQQKRQSRG